MSKMNKTNAGRRVELVYTNDPYTRLKPGDQGTYEWALLSEMMIQHSIKWDDGSSLMLLGGTDRFKWLT